MNNKLAIEQAINESPKWNLIELPKPNIPKKSVTKANHKALRRSIIRYCEFIVKQKLINCGDSIRAYLESRKNTGKSSASVYADKINIKKCFQVLSVYKTNDNVKQKINDIFNDIKIDKPIKTVSVNQIITQKQAKKLIADVKKKNERFAAMLTFLYYTGCRISEMINAEKRNVSKNGSCMILITGTKSKKDRYLRIATQYMNEIEKTFKHSKQFVFETISNTKYIAQNINKLFKNDYVFESLGKKLTPHKLRHSRITHLLTKYDMNAVANFAGNTVDVMLKMYAHTEINQIELDADDLSDDYEDDIQDITINEKETSNNKPKGKFESQMLMNFEAQTNPKIHHLPLKAKKAINKIIKKR
jgi:site-specific recombinase XerD